MEKNKSQNPHKGVLEKKNTIRREGKDAGDIKNWRPIGHSLGRISCLTCGSKKSGLMCTPFTQMIYLPHCKTIMA